MKKVVIIGAGPAGLTAAYELLKDGSGEYEVTVLESLLAELKEAQEVLEYAEAFRW